MEISKVLNESGCFNVIVEEDNKKFSMIFGGDGDLYWSIYKSVDYATNHITFEITKEYYFLYQCFYELYDRIEKCEVLKVTPLEVNLCEDAYERRRLYERILEDNEFLKTEESYSLLFSDGIIRWHSDEDSYDEASVVEIRKNDENFSLTFIPGIYEDEINSVAIRFRNSGSSYSPFNTLFMDMYNSLGKCDFDCYQMHIEECIYRQKMKIKEN